MRLVVLLAFIVFSQPVWAACPLISLTPCKPAIHRNVTGQIGFFAKRVVSSAWKAGDVESAKAGIVGTMNRNSEKVRCFMRYPLDYGACALQQ